MSRQPPTGLRIRVDLEDEVAQHYEQQAIDGGQPIEDVLAYQLSHCMGHDAQKPLYFNDSERHELEQIIGKNVASPKEALIGLRNLSSVNIQGLRIGLKLPLLTRLKSRCLGMKWEDFLEKIIVEDLERYVGMR